jgi:hypothetical protein
MMNKKDLNEKSSEFEVTKEGVAKSENKTESISSFPDRSNSLKEWLSMIESNDNDLYSKVLKVGIYNETSYHELENRLSDSDRNKLGVFYYSFKLRNKLPITHLDVLNNCPPWFLERRLESIAFPVRIYNVVETIDIALVRDFNNYSVEDLLNLPNFGRSSLAELTKILHNAISGGIENINDISFQSIKDSTFTEELHLALKSFSPKLNSTLRSRLGLDGKHATFNEIGKEFGVTRERIRQLEAVGIDKLTLSSAPLGKFPHYLRNYTNAKLLPAYLDTLDSLGPWFYDSNTIISAIEFTIKKKWLPNLYILEINKRKVIAHINQVGWDKLITNALSIVEKASSNPVSLDEISVASKALLPENCSELRDVFWDELQRLLIISDEGKVIGNNKSIESCVQAILQNSNEPIHFKVVAQKVEKLIGKRINLGRVNGVCHQIGWLFDMGTFGMPRHFKFSPEEIDDIIMRSEQIILNSAKIRQWHSNELLMLLQDTIKFSGTRYDIDIMLNNSKILTSLGRHTWKLKDTSIEDTKDRIEIHETITSILIDKGRPMSNAEIKEAVKSRRGLNTHFQIFEKHPVKRIKRGLWGIIGLESKP